jgi:hypothetical protein
MAQTLTNLISQEHGEYIHEEYYYLNRA